MTKRHLAVKNLHARNRLAPPRRHLSPPDPNDELKTIVREGLVSMKLAEREQFVQALEAELHRAGLTMRVFLVPLGIPGHSPAELTPNEVGHLIRFLKINIPQAAAPVRKTMSRFNVFAEKTQHVHNRLAA